MGTMIYAFWSIGKRESELKGSVQRELEGSDHRLGLEEIPAT